MTDEERVKISSRNSTDSPDAGQGNQRAKTRRKAKAPEEPQRRSKQKR